MKYIYSVLLTLFIAMSITGCLDSSSSSNQESKTANVWIIGENPPINSIGAEEDMYLNTSSSDIYVKKNGVWKFTGSVKGQTGVKGDKGDKGDVWYTGASNPDPSISQGKEGDFYINTISSDVFQKQNNLWVKVFNTKGSKGDKGDTGNAGKDGVVWLTGTVSPPPNGITASIGDFYLNINTGQLYKKESAGWSSDPVMVIKGTNGSNGVNGSNGSNGTNGSDGSTWLTGYGNPVGGAGKTGDLYLDLVSGAIYQKSLSGWGSQIAVIKGQKGDTGLPGRDGVNGTAWCYSDTFTDPNGKVIAGCPNDGAGNINDFFLNRVSGDVYQKTTTSTWTKIFTFALASVPSGSIIMFSGPTCPSGYLSADGASHEVSLYPKLAAALWDSSTSKYAWGSTGSTHFNAPDLRGSFPRGVDGNAGLDQQKAARIPIRANGNQGNAVGSFQNFSTARSTTPLTGTTSVTGSHSHDYHTMQGGGVANSVSDTVAATSNATSQTGRSTGASGDHSHVVTITGGGDVETRPANVYVNYCVKF